MLFVAMGVHSHLPGMHRLASIRLTARVRIGVPDDFFHVFEVFLGVISLRDFQSLNLLQQLFDNELHLLVLLLKSGQFEAHDGTL